MDGEHCLVFLIPGVILFPLTYFKLVHEDYTIFAIAIFFCGLLTVAQFSFLSEFLPRVFPMHLRGTGGSFATNFGGRMIGTMAATLNTEILAKLFPGTPPLQVAAAAGVIGGTVYLIALVATFMLPSPPDEPESHAGEPPLRLYGKSHRKFALRIRKDIDREITVFAKEGQDGAGHQGQLRVPAPEPLPLDLL